ncbi:toprim domain-containing protein [Plantactinospora solaniradicis]|uniref:Toprim domain-containing protein n=2 Tax=Plantactinospora solaniradicis TaxID=1723736 RepID=A0ABW1KJU0_9ACTN
MMLSDATRRSLERNSREYASRLTGPALGYLVEERRITKEALAEFRLGYTADSPAVGDPPHRISFPYLTGSGVVQIRFRSLDPDPGDYKYLGVKGVPTTLYNTRVLTESHQKIYVTEGETDCITGWICGLPTVGIPGAKAWKAGYWRAFRYREVVFVADAGKAGSELAQAVSRDIQDCRVVEAPEDDLNYHYCTYGIKSTRELVGLRD